MIRAGIWAALICICVTLTAAETRWTVRPRRTTTTTPKPTTWSSDVSDDMRTPRLLEKYDQRYLDGHYEFRYVLSNGDTRYERSYWLPVGKTKILARTGYYSYPMPNNQFMTVFYTADQNGFHQESTKYSKSQPLLPRHLEVPQYKNLDVVEVDENVQNTKGIKKMSVMNENMLQAENDANAVVVDDKEATTTILPRTRMRLALA